MLRLISHELRTPLNAIIGFSEIIATELYGPIADPRYREHAELVRDAGMKMAGLVNDVIELARLEAGLADIDLQAEELGPLIDEAVRAAAAELADRGVGLQVAGAGADMVRADRRLLSAALTDLIRHVAGVTPAGGAVVVAALRRDAEAIISITPRTPVPERDGLATVRPLDIMAATLTRQGHGLGLPIAQLATRAMGGRLRLAADAEGRLSAAVHLRLAAPPALS